MSDFKFAPLPVRASTDGSIVIDSGHLLRTYPGPAVMLDPRGVIVAANEHADDLSAAIERNALGELIESLSTLAQDQTPMIDSVILPAPFGGATLDLTILPYGARGGGFGGLLLLARNVTLDRSLRNALVESRQRYKDLVECSADFAWETDAQGKFVFVSPRGALGYGAELLIGFAPEALVIDPERPVPASPFASTTPASDVIVWSRNAADQPTCLSVSALPLFDNNGHWAGARGVCRDVTIENRQQQALEQARNRDRALYTIVREIRGEVDLEKVLDTATKAITDALDARACWLFQSKSQGKIPARPDSVYPPDEAVPSRAVFEIVTRMLGGKHTESVVECDGVILATAPYARRTNAVLAVARDRGAEAWSADERILLLAVANQLGVAIEQAVTHAQLELLSRTDPLTGLLNRRAFLDEVGRRLHLDVRTQRPGALLYIDVNNFKAINDTLGHAKGDEAITLMAQLIAGMVRASDVIARVGGDEFVIWLEEADAEGAQAKAAILVAEADKLRDFSASIDAPLGFAIGVAIFDPSSGENLGSLLDRADKAMFKAKQEDSSAYRVAPMPASGDTP